MDSYPMDISVAESSAVERSRFITRTYLHLFGAVGAFVGLEAYLLNIPGVEKMVETMLGTSWLLVLGAFILVSWLAEWWANSVTSMFMQYLGLALYVVAEAVIFVPILYIAQNFYPGVIQQAASATLVMFALLSLVVFLTRKDFSFLQPLVLLGGLAALALIVVSVLFKFELGPIFTYAMIGFACIAILYDTSNVMHKYHTRQHVAAALSLFASVALLFWYILQLFMSRE
ncbi:MAG: Bax inhibitor-1 family protein [Planctomycetia bacterium]|nr:Bax inhibitor-1 family protein [Planctomycetia bacterium]